jgi:hypothetical protein
MPDWESEEELFLQVGGFKKYFSDVAPATGDGTEPGPLN